METSDEVTSATVASLKSQNDEGASVEQLQESWRGLLNIPLHNVNVTLLIYGVM